MNHSSGWYVLYVKPRWEKKVYESLRNVGLEVFLPLARTISQWSDRKRLVLKPLFPSYVFVFANSLHDFHKSLSVVGVCSFVTFGRDYAKVSDDEIHQIKALTESTEVTALKISDDLPKTGEMKQITNGCLKGMICEVVETKGVQKIIVKVKSLKKSVVATLSADDIIEVT